MADHARRGRKRPDSRQMWDESDRRDRRHNGPPGARDGRDDRDRDRERDQRRRRSRSRSPKRDRDPREYRNRSRSPERRDGKRDHDHDRDKTKRGRDGRIPDRPRDRRNDGPVPKEAPSRAEKHAKPRRSVSPPRSPPGKTERSASHNSPLPARPRIDDRDPSNASLSFKVGKHEEEPPSRKKGKDRGRKGREARDDSDEHETSHPSREKGAKRERNRVDKNTPEAAGDRDEDAMDEDEDMVVEDDGGLSAMQAMMGFGGFGSTKGIKVAGNNVGGIRTEKKAEYRQYMNRVGGFNRPLSPSRE